MRAVRESYRARYRTGVVWPTSQSIGLSTDCEASTRLHPLHSILLSPASPSPSVLLSPACAPCHVSNTQFRPRGAVPSVQSCIRRFLEGYSAALTDTAPSGVDCPAPPFLEACKYTVAAETYRPWIPNQVRAGMAMSYTQMTSYAPLFLC